ncbi:MAG: hypothetical protein F9K29_25050 [Hyphomicrobiaceae bacterium]|nr:MAG: hypothetical protein F9K29_25050 [Hyphomicrobiaceae bacterium]
MIKEIVTIRDDEGRQWTGPLVALGRIDNRGLFRGVLTDGWSLLFQSRKYVTIKVDGILRSGREVRSKEA